MGGKMRVSQVLVLAGHWLVLGACGAALTEPEAPAVCHEPAPIPETSSALARDTLFEIEDHPPLSLQQRDLLARIGDRPTSAVVRIARLADAPESLLEVDRGVVLNVSPSLGFVVVGERVERSAADDLSWSGAIAGQHGTVSLVLSGTHATATIHSVPADGPWQMYRVEPLGGSLHAVVCVDATRFPPD